jgi:hypothetical protein
MVRADDFSRCAAGGRFDEWFEQLNDLHKGELLAAISEDVS